MIIKWLRYVYYLIIQRRNDSHPIDSFSDWLDYSDYIEWESDYYDESQAWLCHCGHYEESGLHCECCGAEPPWGCDCGLCDKLDSGDEWLWAWSDYPGDLLVGSVEFEEEEQAA